MQQQGKSGKSKKRKHRRSRHSSSSSDEDDSHTSSLSASEDSSSLSESDSDSSESSSEEEERPRAKKARRSSESDRHGTSRKHGKRRERDKVKHKKRRSTAKESGVKRRKERRESRDKPKKKSKREKISIDDYFIKSAEFRTWLSNERGKFFNDLSSEESRKLFKKFVDKWNSGLLKKKYYKGIPTASVTHDTQSGYKWKFASGIDSRELKTMRESVSSWTANTTKDEVGDEDVTRGSSRAAGVAVGGGSHLIGPQLPGQSQPSSGTSGRGMIGPSIGPRIGPSQGPGRHENTFEREERRETERVRVKKERKDLRKHQEMVLDELLPKATGREARIEKKRAMNQQRKAREASPDVADSTLMGPRADIKHKIRIRQEQRQNRAQAAAQKVSDYAAKEKARVAAILEMAKANKKEGAMW